MQADIALWKSRDGLTEDERRMIKRNLGFFAASEIAGRQQHRAGDLPSPDQPGMPAISAAPVLRGGGAHPHLPVHRGKPRARRGRIVQHVPRGALDHRQGSLGARPHQEPRRRRLQDRHTGGRPGFPARPRRLLRHLRGHVVLHRLRADPIAWPAQQDGRRRRAVPVHLARREHPSELRHRRDQPDQTREPASVDQGVPGRNARHAERRRRA